MTSPADIYDALKATLAATTGLTAASIRFGQPPAQNASHLPAVYISPGSVREDQDEGDLSWQNRAEMDFTIYCIALASDDSPENRWRAGVSFGETVRTQLLSNRALGLSVVHDTHIASHAYAGGEHDAPGRLSVAGYTVTVKWMRGAS